MRTTLSGPSMLTALAFVVSCGGGGSSTPTVTPEPIDSLRLYDSYGDLLTAVLTSMRAGDVAATRASIATPGQVATICPDYTFPPASPYDAGPLEVAVPHCVEVFGPVSEEALAASLESHENGIKAELKPMPGTESYAATCPSVKFYFLPGIFEASGEGVSSAGLEVNGIFTYEGKWGLSQIPRCRGMGE